MMDHDEEKLAPVTVLLAPDAIAAIRMLAKRRHMPMSVLLRQWVMEALDQEQEKTKGRAKP